MWEDLHSFCLGERSRDTQMTTGVVVNLHGLQLHSKVSPLSAMHSNFITTAKLTLSRLIFLC